MTLIDWIGFSGVGILLVAYLLNLFRQIAQDSLVYVLLNLSGAAVACYASVLLNYWPFIILEGIWTTVSLVSLIIVLKRRVSQWLSGHRR